jgi:hypothetical protein
MVTTDRDGTRDFVPPEFFIRQPFRPARIDWAVTIKYGSRQNTGVELETFQTECKASWQE